MTDALPGAGKAGKFDKVYAKKNAAGEITEWKIVECKGGASELGSRAGNQQCTKAYIDSIIENLESKAGSLRSEQIAHLAELKAALRQGEVKNYLLKQPFNVDGSLGTTKLTEYNL